MYDLHTHSLHSDGELSPTDLARAVRAAGISHWALTDHDTVAGAEEAALAATAEGIHFIPGVEVSTRWMKHDIHIVGLRVDPTHPILLAGLAEQAEKRRVRVVQMAAALEPVCGSGLLAALEQRFGTLTLTRAHFAQYLLEQNHIPQFQVAFKRYLGRGKSAYIPTEWASIAEAVGWITQAGGVAVLAHPARYGLTSTKLRELMAHFRSVGGTGIEVVSGVHSPLDVSTLGKLSKQFGLSASMGSDYHGSKMLHVRLGSLPPMPGGCLPIWESW